MKNVLLYDDNVLDNHRERILVDGIDLDRYSKNPVLVAFHELDNAPVGRIVNMRKDSGKLFGDIEWDEEDKDEETQRIIDKYKRGFMKGFSIRVNPLEYSEDPSTWIAGQLFPTIIKSELIEVSVVTVPSHKDAVARRLSSAVVRNIHFNVKIDQKSMEKLRTALIGLLAISIASNEDALIDKAIEDAVRTLKKDLQNSEERAVKLNEEIAKEKAEYLIADAMRSGKITKEAAPVFKDLAIRAYDDTKKAIDALPAANDGKDIVDILRGAGGGPESMESLMKGKENWTFTEWQQKAPQDLAKLRALSPEAFSKLVKERTKKGN